jgi:hypothetical protein
MVSISGEKQVPDGIPENYRGIVYRLLRVHQDLYFFLLTMTDKAPAAAAIIIVCETL